QSYCKEREANPLFSGWLQPVSGNTGKARCRCCNIQFTAEHTVLKNHAKSNKHQEKSKCLAPTQKSITQCMQVKPNPEKLKLETAIKTAELKLAGFLAEHNIAMRAADHLTDVLKDIFKDSNITQNLSFGRTKATAISKNIIGSCYFEELSEILKRKKSSVLIDESTDIGNVKTLCIVVHFFDNTKSVQTCSWKLAQIFSAQNRDAAQEGASAERLLMQVYLSNILGFGSDGCNTMMGKNNSVASRLQNEFPGILLQHCTCHSLHLCVSAACIQLPRRCEDLARDVYNYFKNSSKHMAQYQEFCHVEPHKLLKPSQTRWLSLQQVVKRISSQWDALLLFFTSQWLEARLNAAENIYRCLNDAWLRLYYYFLEWSLPKFTNLNENFQSEKVMITTLRSKMAETYKDILLSYMESNYAVMTPLSRLDPADASKFLPLSNMYLGVKQENPSHSQGILTNFRVRCQRFLVTACLEIKKRFNFDDPVLTHIECLTPSIATDQRSWSLYPSLLPLLQKVPRIVDPENTDLIQLIDDQWRQVPLMKLPENFKEMDVDQFWYNVLVLEDLGGRRVLKELAAFALDILIFPHSNASCKRVFSKINLIKNKTK
uniref:DUF4371 domain-containing protein n=1 Tax=Latimeria chalumnae TaxID=7897 RepID=H3BFK0_LATCH